MSHNLQRYLSLLLSCFIFLSCLSVRVIAEESDTMVTDPTEASTEPSSEPTEVSTEPSSEPTEAPTEPSSEPTEAPTEPSSEPTETPTEPSSEPTETPTEPSSEPTEAPTEPSSEPTEAPTEPTEEPTEPPTEPTVPEEPLPKNPSLRFGQLHAHTGTAHESATVQTLFQTAAQSGNLDFFAVTEYGDSFDAACSGTLSEASADPKWTSGKAAAAAVTTETFAGIFGFEMNWPERMQIGHISVFNTPGYQSWLPDAYGNPARMLKDFYAAASALPGAIGQWNHPGNQYGTFFGFENYTEAADNFLQLLEVANSASTTAAGYLSGYQYYSRALDKGWHVAPTNSQGNGRTVICSQTLSESALYDAIRSHRVYATEDSDLEILYTLDGYSMGSRLKKWHVGQTAEITADLYDPTDSTIGQVEVIVDGGTVAARQTLASGCGILQFSLDPNYHYYYLRIIQPDGDVAVTAPVWMEHTENLGISDLTCETAVPVQNEAVSLVLECYNRERTDLLVESLTILADGSVIAEDTALTEIPAGSGLSHELTIQYDGIGQTEITVILSGTLNGAVRQYTQTIPLSFRQSQQVRDILIDGSHGNAGLSDLTLFTSMAAEENIRLTVADREITEAILQNCRFLVITAPAQPFAEPFLAAAAEYVRYGGNLLLCGQSAERDGGAAARELNRLLEAIGSTMRFNRDAVADPMYNGGEETLLYLNDILDSSFWCSGITEGQVYRHADGCSVFPGNGIPLVNNQTAQIRARTSPLTVLASEEIASGGTVLAAGSLLIENAALKEPGNLWDAPYANRTISQNLLGIGDEILPLSTIRQAWEAETGTILRVRGYVTAGTANVWNHFPDTLYLQDDTGGIAVIPFAGEDIAVGTPMEITGAAEIRDGNPVLKPISWDVLNLSFYRYLPRTEDWKTLLDAGLHGGELVQAEGTCTEVLLADDGRVCAITLADTAGNLAQVLIEDCIFSGSTGKNELQETVRKGRTIRAMGILHVDPDGNPVIRVRNCAEVVYVPPRTVYINPKTGDWLAQLIK